MATFGGPLFGGGGSGSTSGVATASMSDLLYHAMRLAGVILGPDRGPSPGQYNDALRAARRMLGRWNTDGLLIECGRIESFALVADQKAYTMGPGGEFDTTRPQRIERANLILADGSRKPLEVIEVDRWADIRLQDETSEPLKLFSDRAPGLVNIYVWPQDSGVNQLELFTWKLFDRIESKDDEVTWADGYEEAFVTNLGIRLAIMWRLPVHGDLRELARTALSDVASLNAPAPTMLCDPSIVLAGQVWRTPTE
jgi:hypothetical protein